MLVRKCGKSPPFYGVVRLQQLRQSRDDKPESRSKEAGIWGLNPRGRNFMGFNFFEKNWFPLRDRLGLQKGSSGSFK